MNNSIKKSASYLVLLGTVVVGGMLAATRTHPSVLTLDTLVRRSVGGIVPRYGVWFVFRPADCQLSAALIRELNALAGHESVAVQGIMLQPPEDSTEAARLPAALGMSFPVELDSNGEWKAALLTESFGGSTVILRQNGRTIGEFMPEAFYRVARELIPAVVAANVEAE